MLRKKAVTLIELLIAISLIGVMAVAISSLEGSFYGIKETILYKQQPVIQGNLAMAHIFERVLRASAVTNGPAFTISSDGKSITYHRSGRNERIWLEGSIIKYNDGVRSDKTILANVASLTFSRPYQNRLDAEIVLNSGEKFRTSVQPRNEFTPQNVIN